jgi:hypothetical protein
MNMRRFAETGSTARDSFESSGMLLVLGVFEFMYFNSFNRQASR